MRAPQLHIAQPASITASWEGIVEVRDMRIVAIGIELAAWCSSIAREWGAFKRNYPEIHADANSAI